MQRGKGLMGKSRVGAVVVRVRRTGMIHADVWGKAIQAKHCKGLTWWRNSKEAGVSGTENEDGEVTGHPALHDLVGPGADDGFILVKPLEG